VSETKCFISRDEQAFAKDEVKQQLATFNCSYRDSFQKGLEFIQRQLQPDALPPQEQT